MDQPTAEFEQLNSSLLEKEKQLTNDVFKQQYKHQSLTTVL